MFPETLITIHLEAGEFYWSCGGGISFWGEFVWNLMIYSSVICLCVVLWVVSGISCILVTTSPRESSTLQSRDWLSKIVPSVSYWEGVRGLYHVRSLLSLRREWARHSSLVRNCHIILRVPQLSLPASTSLLEFVLKIFQPLPFHVSLPTLAAFALFSKKCGISSCQDGLTDGLFCPGLSLCRNISLHSCPQGA